MANNNKPTIIVGNGNGALIIALASKALRRAGQADKVEAYQKEAMSGDYDHLLQVTMDYVEIEME